MQSLVTGQLRIDLGFRSDVPSQTVGLMPDVPEIPAIPSDLDQIKNKLSDLPIRELARMAQQALESIDKLSKHIDAELTPLVSSVKKTANAATESFNKANNVMDTLSGSHAPFRNNLEATARDLAASASSLRNFSHNLERDPSVLLRGRTNP